jgi:hypothetical protein
VNKDRNYWVFQEEKGEDDGSTDRYGNPRGNKAPGGRDIGGDVSHYHYSVWQSYSI